MQLELKAIQREVGITFMFVTHDQDEAMTLSDRIAVFNAGRIEQLGTPYEVYEQPASAFVAGFVGTSNVLSGSSAEALYGESGTFAIRPERVRLANGTADPGEVQTTGTVTEVVYAGAETRIVVRLDVGDSMTAVRPSTAGKQEVARGERVDLAWSRSDVADLASPAAVADQAR
jgi:putative spermidine/putrescine transport system ATP-binding protein